MVGFYFMFPYIPMSLLTYDFVLELSWDGFFDWKHAGFNSIVSMNVE